MKAKTKKARIKVQALKKVTGDQVGHLNKNGVKTEANEDNTFEYLTLFGFNVDLIRPTSTKKTRNPDIFIAGTIWEVKTPVSSNRNTIKKRFREASKQAIRVVFDLRSIKQGADKVEEQVVEMFKNSGRVRSLMIIEENGKLLDFRK